MSIDTLENPATNNSSNPQMGNKIGGDAGKESSPGWAATIGAYLSGVPAAIGAGARGIGQYGYDTLFEKSNNVPYGVRAAVGAAKKSEDKLRALRQFYKDAMPLPDGDFTFIDPQTRKRITLNDKGLSVGDMIESIPDIGETVGGIGGSIIGAGLGTAGGPAGTGAGGVLGAGVGAATGESLSRSLMGALLSGEKPIDSRTGGEKFTDSLVTGGLNSAFQAVPFGGKYLKNKLSEKYLTPESGNLFKYFADKGYKPTLAQVGSEAGKQAADRRMAGGMIGKELHNQGVFNKEKSRLLGTPLDELDENALANKFRSSQKEGISGLKDDASQMFDQIKFGDDIIPAEKSRSAIEDIYRKRGMVLAEDGTYVLPKGSSPNPDFVLDGSMERKMNRVMRGEASESEIESFRSDIKTALRNRDIKYDTKGALLSLDKSLTDDLVQGSPALSEADKAARKAWFEYKDTQKQVKNIIGRSEGVTANTEIGQGLTEGQALGNARGIFSNTAKGSDAEATALAQIINPDDKKTLLSSILQQGKSGGGASDVLDGVNQNYNLERIGKFLVNPEDKALFDDIMKQAQGTRLLAPGARDKTKHIYGEAAATLGTAAVDPVYTPLTIAYGNILRGAPGMYGGSGQMTTSGLTHNSFAEIGRQAKEAYALRMARQGQVPGNLTAMPNTSSIAGMGVGGQMAAGNMGDSRESNLRIPESAINENLPANSALRNPLPEYTLDDLTAMKSAPQTTNPDLPSVSLDQLLDPRSQDPNMKPPVREMQPSVILPKTNEMGQTLPQREMQRLPTPDDLNKYAEERYGSGSRTGPSIKDLEQYAEERYGNPIKRKASSGAPPIANKSIPAAGVAFLKTLSGPGLEGADYYTLVGGSKIDDLSEHPNVVGVTTEYGPSTAFGRYQFTNTTWKEQQAKHGYKDMSPETQDKAAWDLAQERYNKITGGNFLDELNSKDPRRIYRATTVLAPTWTSLPGGPQQGSGASKFMNNYFKNLDGESLTEGDLEDYIQKRYGGNTITDAPKDSPKMQNLNFDPSQGQPPIMDIPTGAEPPIMEVGNRASKNNCAPLSSCGTMASNSPTPTSYAPSQSNYSMSAPSSPCAGGRCGNAYGPVGSPEYEQGEKILAAERMNPPPPIQQDISLEIPSNEYNGNPQFGAKAPPQYSILLDDLLRDY